MSDEFEVLADLESEYDFSDLLNDELDEPEELGSDADEIGQGDGEPPETDTPDELTEDEDFEVAILTETATEVDEEEPAAAVNENTETDSLSMIDQAGAPIVCVCGIGGGVGTTMLAALLAYAFASPTKKPVLLGDLGGPSSSLSIYLDRRGTHSLASAANARRAGVLDETKPPFADVKPGLRLMATSPGETEELAPGVADPVFCSLLAEAQASHSMVVLDCGRLEQPAEYAAASQATHIIWAIDGTKPGIKRAVSSLSNLKVAGSQMDFLVVRAKSSEATAGTAERDLRKLSSMTGASTVMWPELADLATAGLSSATEQVAMPLRAILQRIIR